MKTMSIVLGCGVHDGTDIHEAFACRAAVTAVGFLPVFYSLDKARPFLIKGSLWLDIVVELRMQYRRINLRPMRRFYGFVI